jgi:hypothetical protein
MSQQASKPLETLYCPKEAAEFLKVDERTLGRWRMLGIGPKYIKISGRVIRYEESELRRFTAELTRQSTWDAIDSAAAATSNDGGKKAALRSMVKEVIQELMGPDAEGSAEEGAP